MNVLMQKNFNNACVGCGACEKICTRNAITFHRAKDGFDYPSVNRDLCTDCGLCVRVCQIGNNTNKRSNEKYLRFSSDNEVRDKSSSGGAFYHLATGIINENGVVFGAYFDKTEKKVKHGSSDRIPLEKLMRSKYVQSDLDDSFVDVKRFLKEGRKVAFCGTPCQVQALNLFLGKKYENLLTIDFICHGVPAESLLSEYLRVKENEKNLKVRDITFREKDSGWRTQVVKLYFEDGSCETEKSRKNPYYSLFYNGVTLRKSCYYCKLPSNHLSDITLFDCWNVKNDDDFGVSGIIINTENGMQHIKNNNVFDSAVEDDISNLPDYYFLDHSDFKSNYINFVARKLFFSYKAKKGVDAAFTKWYPIYDKIIKKL